MEATEKRTRVQRFKRRSKDEAARIQPTKRDDAILLLLRDYRVLDSRQIAAFLSFQGWSEAETKRRLRKLYDLGLLDKPEAQLKYYLEAGSRPTVYALGDEGAVYLEQRHGIIRRTTRERDKNREVKREQIEHWLLIAETMLSFARACYQRGDVRLIHAHEILAAAPAEVREELRPFSWQVEAVWDGTKFRPSVVPDKVFGIEFLTRPEGQRKTWFMLEADTGSETVMPRDPKNEKKLTLFHKFLGYAASHEQGIVTARYGFRGFRVLTLTARSGEQVGTDPSSGEKRRLTRIMSLQETAMKACGKHPPGSYLFADLTTLLEHPDVLAMPWQTANGKTVYLDPTTRSSS